MNIFEQLKQQINDIAIKSFNLLPEPKQLSVELPKTEGHGDISTNVAMILAKPLSKSPMQIAEIIVAQLKELEYIEEVNIAAPGFINITLKTDIWHKTLARIIKQDLAFGDNNLGMDEKINIEFVSVNPTGPMHIGHCRGGIYGDSLANLMIKCGYKVTKEFYVNDAGGQVMTLAKSAYLRYLECCGEEIGEIPEGLYPGDYLIPVERLYLTNMDQGLKIWK